MSPQVLSGVIRVTTHPLVFSRPSALAEVIGFCELLIAQPHCAVRHPGPQHWSIFVRLCKDADARGNLVPDAWFAALAVESGCDWVTTDRDYARFHGLKWHAPS
jgi:uncharacterized protein